MNSHKPDNATASTTNVTTPSEKKPNRWFELDNHWQNLSGWFNPTVTRLFISWFALTPVFIKVIGDLPETIAFSTEGGSIIKFNVGLPFSWWVLWGASLFYAVAFAIYVLKCPRFIKDYRSYTDYVQRRHSPRWLVSEFYHTWNSITEAEKAQLLTRTTEKKLVFEQDNAKQLTAKPSVESDATRFIFKHNDKKYAVEIGEKLPVSAQRELFWELFGIWSSTHVISRISSWGFLFLALAIVAFIVSQNIYFVLRYLIS